MDAENVKSYLKQSKVGRPVPVDAPTLKALCKYWQDHQPKYMPEKPDDNILVLVLDGEDVVSGLIEDGIWYDESGMKIENFVCWWNYPEYPEEK